MGWASICFLASASLFASSCGDALSAREFSYRDSSLGISFHAKDSGSGVIVGEFTVTGDGGDKSRENPNEPSEPPKKCFSRNLILFSASSAANLVGSYSAFSDVKWNENLSWYAATLQWIAEKTKNGIASPSDYAHAFRENADFRYNNAWNAVLMGTVSSVECLLGKPKSNAVILATSFVSSLAGQMMTKGEISLSQAVLDTIFVRIATLGRARLGAAVDRRFFQRHAFRLTKVSAYYLVDQYVGGFGYGIYQNTAIKGWPERLNIRIKAHDFNLFPEPSLETESKLEDLF